MSDTVRYISHPGYHSLIRADKADEATRTDATIERYGAYFFEVSRDLSERYDAALDAFDSATDAMLHIRMSRMSAPPVWRDPGVLCRG